MKKILLLLTICIIYLSSCSIEKRLYRPGWNIGSHSRIKSGSGGINQNEAINSEEVTNTKNSSKILLDENAKVNDFKNVEIIEYVKDKTSNSSNILIGKNEVNKTNKFDHYMQNNSLENSVGNQFNDIHNMKNITKNEKLKNQSTSGSENGVIRGIGWFFIILGILFVIFVSILIGILLMLIGLLFFVVGR
jgi:hypothetical protein